MITVDLQTFQRSRQNGSVTGTIFLELPAGAFPALAWSDFPVIILAWWIDAWQQLENPERRKVSWQFMDGPYRAILTTGGGGQSDSVQSADVRDALLEAGRKVVAHCQQLNMVGKDLELLLRKIEQLAARQIIPQSDFIVHIEGARR